LFDRPKISSIFFLKLLLRIQKEVIKVAGGLKMVECDPKCGFMVRSHDEKEIIDIIKQHAKKAHNMSVSDKDAASKMKDAA